MIGSTINHGGSQWKEMMFNSFAAPCQVMTRHSTLWLKNTKRVFTPWHGGRLAIFTMPREITQDTFLQVYKKLPTLKNPNQFAGWLYVIANRLCLNWLRKKRPAIQSLEGTSAAETERFSYNHYVSEQRETEASEHRYEIVKKLLARLPESERTVMTLYYLRRNASEGNW